MKQNGETFYADPDTIHNQVYTGYRVQYQAYKQAQLLASRQNPALNVHPDPHGVVVNEFDGWVPGPLAPIDGYGRTGASNTLQATPRCAKGKDGVSECCGRCSSPTSSKKPPSQSI